MKIKNYPAAVSFGVLSDGFYKAYEGILADDKNCVNTDLYNKVVGDIVFFEDGYLMISSLFGSENEFVSVVNLLSFDNVKIQGLKEDEIKDIYYFSNDFFVVVLLATNIYL